MKTEQRLKELGIELAQATVADGELRERRAHRQPALSRGQGPGPAGPAAAGRARSAATSPIEQGYEYARQTGLSLIAVMKAELGDLDKVKRIVKVLGMVNATPEFGHQPEVINGCSDLFVEVFGDRGRHARSAVGMGSLPRGIPVEIEVIVEVEAGRLGAQPPPPSAAARRKAAPKAKEEGRPRKRRARGFDRPKTGRRSRASRQEPSCPRPTRPTVSAPVPTNAGISASSAAATSPRP